MVAAPQFDWKLHADIWRKRVIALPRWPRIRMQQGRGIFLNHSGKYATSPKTIAVYMPTLVSHRVQLDFHCVVDNDARVLLRHVLDGAMTLGLCVSRMPGGFAAEA